jgi:hypothetical protein
MVKTESRDARILLLRRNFKLVCSVATMIVRSTGTVTAKVPSKTISSNPFALPCLEKSLLR